MRRLVHSLGYRYRLHVHSLPGTPDLVFSRRRKIIDVRGCFWHQHHCGRCRIPKARRSYWFAKLERNRRKVRGRKAEKARRRDQRNLRALRRAGWRVLVIWECQTTVAQRARLRDRIVRFLADDETKSSTGKTKVRNC